VEGHAQRARDRLDDTHDSLARSLRPRSHTAIRILYHPALQGPLPQVVETQTPQTQDAPGEFVL
jgi:hypothetical protein